MKSWLCQQSLTYLHTWTTVEGLKDYLDFKGFIITAAQVPRISTKLIDTAKTEVKIILQFCYLLSLFAK